MKLLRLILITLSAFVCAGVASAQQAQPTSVATQPPPFILQAQELANLLKGEIPYDAYFADSFKASVPRAQVDQLINDLKTAYGPVRSVGKISAVSQISGTVEVTYERATVRFTLTVSPDAPHKVIGLFTAGVYQANDNAQKIGEEIKALPGKAGLLVQRLDTPEAPKIAIEPSTPFAVASGFKLWVLAEAARSVQARERSWNQVIPLGRASLPTGITQGWPQDTPVTLHTLATLMISISDNTATDTLLMRLGRDRVGRMMSSIGNAAPQKTLPILSTLELFSLKAERNAPIRNAYINADLARRTQLLGQFSPELSSKSLNPVEFAGTPRSIDTIEWFASPNDMNRTLNWLRINGGREARDILAINKGIAADDAARFAYVGYKGGSENGVLSMHLLIQNKKGAWYGVSGSWNNPAAPVNEMVFVSLITRAAMLVE
jgi:beta-lactamase class A